MRTTSWRIEERDLSIVPVPEQLFGTSFVALTMDASRKTSCHPMKWVDGRKTSFWFSIPGLELHSGHTSRFLHRSGRGDRQPRRRATLPQAPPANSNKIPPKRLFTLAVAAAH